jgi:hypothetical protein
MITTCKMQNDENSAGNTQDDCAEKPSIQLCWGKNKANVGEPINTTPLGEDKATRWGVSKPLATDKSTLLGISQSIHR